jgi:hypothetical protein
MLVFTQNFSRTIFLSFADTIFQQTLPTFITKYAPGCLGMYKIPEGAIWTSDPGLAHKSKVLGTK